MADQPSRVALELAWPKRHAVAMGLVLAVPVLLAWRCPGALAPFLLAWVLAYLLNPIVDALELLLRRLPECLRGFGPSKAKGARPLAVIVFFLWLLTVVALIGFPMVVALVSNVYTLADQVSSHTPGQYQEMARRAVDELQTRLNGVPILRDAARKIASEPNLVGTAAAALQTAVNFLGRQIQSLASLLGSVFAAGASLAIVPLLLFYLMLDWDRLWGLARSAVPEPYKPWFDDFLSRLEYTLGGYVRAQLAICVLFGTAMTLGLLALGVPYAMLLGPLAGAADFIPYMGVLIGLLPAALLVLVQRGFGVAGLWGMGGLALLFALINMFDSLFLQPRIMGGRVGLHPMAILFALALGQNLGGLYGLLLAVPGAALVKVLLVDVKRALWEPEPTDSSRTAVPARSPSPSRTE